MPDAPGLELIAQELNEAHAGTVTGTYHEHGEACLIVEPERVLDALLWLRDTPGQEYTFLASLHGVDYLPAEPRFGVIYELLCMARVERLRLRAALADPAAVAGDGGEPDGPVAAREAGSGREELLPALPSAVGVFPGAEFPEREVYDFFGIEFTGHPDLRRILMPEDYAGWPQRRDFPVGGEPVIFTHNERETPGWYR